MRDCFTKVKTGMDYVQYLQSTRPAAIMTYVHFWTCVMIAAGLVLQDTKL